jgi:hypothetical protein
MEALKFSPRMGTRPRDILLKWCKALIIDIIRVRIKKCQNMQILLIFPIMQLTFRFKRVDGRKLHF